MCSILAQKWFHNMSSFPLLNQWQSGFKPWPAALLCPQDSPYFSVQPTYCISWRINCGYSPEGGAQECHLWPRPLCGLVCGGGELQMYSGWEVNKQTQKGLFKSLKSGKCEWDTDDCRINPIPVFTVEQTYTGLDKNNKNNI